MDGFEGIEKPIVGVPRMPPGMRAKYIPNHRSFGAFMRSDQMRDVTTEAARDVAIDATATVPPPHSEADPKDVDVTYEAKRDGGLIKVAGNLRVRVLVEGKGRGAERAEFGHSNGDGRYRHLARTASRHGDWKPVD